MPLTCVINDVKSGKSYQKQLDGTFLAGKKLGDTVSGGMLELAGYELLITGGSDTAGFPLKKELEGSGRKKMLLKKGATGTRHTRHGDILRKTVRGHSISDLTTQVNLKISKYGTKSVEELLGVKKEEPAAAPVAEKKEAPEQKK